MLTTALLAALALSPAAHAAGKWGPPVTYYPDAEKPKVDYWRVGGASVGVVLTEDACDGLIGKDAHCGDTADTAWGGTKAHNPAADITASLTPVDGGPALESGATNTLIRQRNFLQTAAFTIDTKEVDRSLTVSVSGATDKIGLVLDAESWSDGTWDEATDTTHTYAVRLVNNGDGTGYLELKVQGLAKNADLSAVTSAQISSDQAVDGSGTTTVGLGLARTRAKVKMKLATVQDGASTDGFSYDYKITIEDVDETISGRRLLSSEDHTAGIVTSKLSQKKNGDLKHVAWTIDDDPDANQALDVAIYDDVTGEALIVLDADEPSRRVEVNADGALDFDADGDFDASLTICPLDSAGTVLATCIDATVSFTDGEQAVDLGAWSTDKNQAGLYIAKDGSSADLHAVLPDIGIGEIAAVEVQFNEPFEGPSPLENPLTLSMDTVVMKWVQTAELTDTQATGDLEVDLAFYGFGSEGEGADDFDASDYIFESLTRTGALGETYTSASVSATASNVVKVVKSMTGLGLK